MADAIRDLCAELEHDAADKIVQFEHAMDMHRQWMAQTREDTISSFKSSNQIKLVCPPTVLPARRAVVPITSTIFKPAHFLRTPAVGTNSMSSEAMRYSFMPSHNLDDFFTADPESCITAGTAKPKRVPKTKHVIKPAQNVDSSVSSNENVAQKLTSPQVLPLKRKSDEVSAPVESAATLVSATCLVGHISSFAAVATESEVDKLPIKKKKTSGTKKTEATKKRKSSTELMVTDRDSLSSVGFADTFSQLNLVTVESVQPIIASTTSIISTATNAISISASASLSSILSASSSATAATVATVTSTSIVPAEIPRRVTRRNAAAGKFDEPVMAPPKKPARTKAALSKLDRNTVVENTTSSKIATPFKPTFGSLCKSAVKPPGSVVPQPAHSSDATVDFMAAFHVTVAAPPQAAIIANTLSQNEIAATAVAIVSRVESVLDDSENAVPKKKLGRLKKNATVVAAVASVPEGRVMRSRVAPVTQLVHPALNAAMPISVIPETAATPVLMVVEHAKDCVSLFEPAPHASSIKSVRKCPASNVVEMIAETFILPAEESLLSLPLQSLFTKAMANSTTILDNAATPIIATTTAPEIQAPNSTEKSFAASLSSPLVDIMVITPVPDSVAPTAQSGTMHSAARKRSIVTPMVTDADNATSMIYTNHFPTSNTPIVLVPATSAIVAPILDTESTSRMSVIATGNVSVLNTTSVIHNAAPVKKLTLVGIKKIPSLSTMSGAVAGSMGELQRGASAMFGSFSNKCVASCVPATPLTNSIITLTTTLSAEAPRLLSVVSESEPMVNNGHTIPAVIVVATPSTQPFVTAPISGLVGFAPEALIVSKPEVSASSVISAVSRVPSAGLSIASKLSSSMDDEEDEVDDDKAFTSMSARFSSVVATAASLVKQNVVLSSVQAAKSVPNILSTAITRPAASSNLPVSKIISAPIVSNISAAPRTAPGIAATIANLFKTKSPKTKSPATLPRSMISVAPVVVNMLNTICSASTANVPPTQHNSISAAIIQAPQHLDSQPHQVVADMPRKLAGVAGEMTFVGVTGTSVAQSDSAPLDIDAIQFVEATPVNQVIIGDLPLGSIATQSHVKRVSDWASGFASEASSSLAIEMEVELIRTSDAAIHSSRRTSRGVAAVVSEPSIVSELSSGIQTTGVTVGNTVPISLHVGTPVVPLVSVIAPRLANLLQTSSFVKRALPVGLQSTVPVPGAAVTKSPPRQVKALEMAKIELAKHNARVEEKKQRADAVLKLMNDRKAKPVTVAVPIVPTTTVAVVPPRKILQPSAAEEAKRIVPKAVERAPALKASTTALLPMINATTNENITIETASAATTALATGASRAVLAAISTTSASNTANVNPPNVTLPVVAPLISSAANALTSFATLIIKPFIQAAASKLVPVTVQVDPPTLGTTSMTSTVSNASGAVLASMKAVVPSVPIESQSIKIADYRSSDDESDEDAPREKVPQWATSPQIRAALSKMTTRPDEIFPPQNARTCDLDTIFKDFKKTKRFHHRTSSGNWNKDQ